MLEFFKKIKENQFENKTDIQQTAPKKDKVFIGILIVFALVIIVSLVLGIGNISSGSAVETLDYEFKFSITDSVILGGVLLAYVITCIRKGRK